MSGTSLPASTETHWASVSKACFQVVLLGNREKKSTADDIISPGHGRHACPGRFFASAEIKIILIGLLQNYDIKLCDDYREGRPLNILTEFMAHQDHTYEVCFRKRAV